MIGQEVRLIVAHLFIYLFFVADFNSIPFHFIHFLEKLDIVKRGQVTPKLAGLNTTTDSSATLRLTVPSGAAGSQGPRNRMLCCSDAFYSPLINSGAILNS